MQIDSKFFLAGIGVFLLLGVAIAYSYYGSQARGVHSGHRFNREIDAGTVYAGTRQQYDVLLSNDTDREWAIAKLSSTCGCTVPGDLPDTISPGTSITLPIVVSFGKPVNAFQSSVRVILKDELPIRINITARVIEAMPDVLDVGEGLVDETLSGRVLIASRTGNPVSIISLEPASDYLVATHGRSANGPNDREVVVSMTVPRPGPIDEVVRIRFTDGHAGADAVQTHELLVRARGYEKVESDVKNVILPRGVDIATVQLAFNYNQIPYNVDISTDLGDIIALSKNIVPDSTSGTIHISMHARSEKLTIGELHISAQYEDGSVHAFALPVYIDGTP